MAKYIEALNTSLGDYLELTATKMGVSRKKLESMVEIKPLKVEGVKLFFDPRDDAVKKFDLMASEYDAVVDLKENPSELGSVLFLIYKRYVITGTGVRIRRKFKEKSGRKSTSKTSKG